MILMFRREEFENHCSVQGRYVHWFLSLARSIADILLVN